MSWAYSGNPTVSSKDRVRFLIGDTDTNRQLLQDEEIEFLLGSEANAYRAAAQACRVVAMKARNVTSKSVGGLSISYGDPSVWSMLAKSLDNRGRGHQVPYVGGISQTDKDAHRADTDNTQAAFTRDLHDMPGSLRPDTPLSDD